jgi:hypothetical protein
MTIWGPTEDAIIGSTSCMARQSIWLESRLSVAASRHGRSNIGLIAGEQLGFGNLFFWSVANLHYSSAKGF